MKKYLGPLVKTTCCAAMAASLVMYGTSQSLNYTDYAAIAEAKPSDYNTNGAINELKKSETKVAELIAEFEKNKTEGKLLGGNHLEDFKWFDLLCRMTNVVRNIADYYQSALSDGWKHSDPEMKTIRTKIEEIITKFEKCGFKTCLNLEDQVMNEWAELDRLAFKAHMISELAKNKGDIKMIKETKESIAQDLERYLKYSDAKEKDPSSSTNATVGLAKHPGFTRAKIEIDKYLKDCEGCLNDLLKAKNSAREQWIALHKERERMVEFFNKVDSSNNIHPDGIEKLIGEIEDFEKKELAGLREKLEKFSANYGTNENDLNNKINELFDNDKPENIMDPGYLYQEFSKGIENIGKARKDMAETISGEVKSSLEIINNINEDSRPKKYEEIKNRIALGLKCDPKNGDLQKFMASIDEISAKDSADTQQKIKDQKWPGNVKNFAGPGDPDELCKAAIEYFSRTCQSNEHALAACIAEDNWYVFKRNIFNQPVQYALTFFVAVSDDNAKDKEIVKVYSISFLTNEDVNSKKEPPFAAAAFNQQFKMLKANVPAAK
ncbi:MAG: hypothetical protein QMC67_17045 [Candidatus Wallbacteria bacterium]